MKRIKSVAEFKALFTSQEDRGLVLEFRIQLCDGHAYTRQAISYNNDEDHPDTFEVLNLSDETTQYLTEAGLFTESNIGEAITKGAFLCEDVD